MSWILYAAITGLLVGSFLNVVIHRVPRGHSIVLPRSRCPFCGRGLSALDNIPVLSFVVLRGRCRSCGAPISWQYPLVELLTSALFVLCVVRFGVTAEAIVAAVFCALLVALAGIDAGFLLLPDKITLPGIMVGLLLQAWLPRTTLLDAILGVLVGAGILILMINFWYWLRDEEGMGLGDVNMLAMIGAFLGWRGVLVTLFAGALAGAAVGLGLMASHRLGLRSKLPFGAFLAAGALAALFWGEQLARRYAALL